jgi:AcrR family transcriptional regulator
MQFHSVKGQETTMGHDADKPRRRSASGEASRQKILDAAGALAAERGYEGTSIGAVSERSGMPASSIYWHFKDKDALFAAVIERSFEQWLAGMGSWTPKIANRPLQERFTASMHRTVKALLESSDFLRLGLMLTLEHRTEELSARRMFLSVREEALRRIRSSYAEAFPELDSAGLGQLATFTMAMADGLFIVAEVEGDSSDIFAQLDLLAAALLGAASHLVNAAAATRKTR